MTTKYFEMIPLLLERIPELRVQYGKELEWWGGEHPGPHVVYGDLLNPLLVELLNRNGDEALLRRVFSLLEELSKSEEDGVKDVVGVTVIQYLLGERDLIEKARRYMGPETLIIAGELQNWRPTDRNEA
jgi:hypothetical protein